MRFACVEYTTKTGRIWRPTPSFARNHGDTRGCRMLWAPTVALAKVGTAAEGLPAVIQKYQ